MRKNDLDSGHHGRARPRPARRRLRQRRLEHDFGVGRRHGRLDDRFGDDTSVTADDTSSDSSGGVDTEAFLYECNDASALRARLRPSRPASRPPMLSSSAPVQANNDSAIAICQTAADEAVKQLQAAG